MHYLRQSFPYSDIVLRLNSWEEEDFALNLVCLQKTEQFQRNLALTSGLTDLQFSPDIPRPRVVRVIQPTSRDASEMIRDVNAQF